MSTDASTSQQPIAPLAASSSSDSKPSPRVKPTTKEEEICDDWEQLDQNQIKKSLQSIKLSQATENEEKTIKCLPKPNVATFPPQTTNPTSNNPIKILKRPPSDKSLKDMYAANPNPAQPIKTFEQREQEYAQARLRILGSAHPEQDPVNQTSNNSYNQTQNYNIRSNQNPSGNNNNPRQNYSPNNNNNSGLPNNSLVRDPLAPDGSRGFNKRSYNYNQNIQGNNNSNNANSFRNNKS